MSTFEMHVIIARVNIKQYRNSGIEWTLMPEEYYEN